MARVEKICGREIDFDKTYFVAYFGGPREMTEKERREYDVANGMPDSLKFKILARLDPRKNPNYHPHDGVSLLEIILEQGYIPVFDVHFDTTNKLTLVHVFAYEWYKRVYRKRQRDME